MSEYTFKLAIQTGHTAHFAQVTVDVTRSEADVVEIACGPEEIRGWKGAVVEGADAALADLRHRGLLSAPTSVRIVKFIGIPTDTDDMDARTAAYVAVARAVAKSEHSPDIDRKDLESRWQILWSPK